MSQSCFLPTVPLQRAIACLLVSTLAWGSARAQPTSGPTDRQLQAAHCLGGEEERLVEGKEFKFSAPDPPKTLEAIFAEKKASEDAKYTRPPAQFMEPSQYKAHMNSLLAMAKSFYDNEINLYAAQLRLLSTRQDLEKIRQRLYSYLVASGAFDYLTLAPAGPSGVTVARDNGVADQQQCFSATSVYPGLPDRAMSKEEMGKFKQDLTQCMQKTLDGTPACVKTARCKQFEAELP